MPPTLAAYGVEIEGIDAREELAVAPPRAWPLLRVSQRTPEGPAPELFVDADRASVAVLGGRWELDRATLSGTLELEAGPCPQDELVHPYLWPACSVIARWTEREPLHAGAFLVDGAAWAVAGDSGQGKSALLAWMAERGHPVLVDDLLVVEGHRCFAGPRCLDLRPEAAERLGLNGRTRPVRATSRRRLSLEPIAGEHPLAGWVFLEWGETVAVDPLPVRARMHRVALFQRLRSLDPDGLAYLEYARLPAWVLRRPQDWARIDEVNERLLSVLAGAAPS